MRERVGGGRKQGCYTGTKRQWRKGGRVDDGNKRGRNGARQGRREGGSERGRDCARKGWSKGARK